MRCPAEKKKKGAGERGWREKDRKKLGIQIEKCRRERKTAKKRERRRRSSQRGEEGKLERGSEGK